nr:oligosaccharide repeat unit polymerase [Colwellia sp. E2M01]
MEVGVLNFSIIFLLVFAYIGLFILYFGLDSYRYQSGIIDKYTVLLMLLCSSWSILCITTTYIFFNNFYGLKIKPLSILDYNSMNNRELLLVLIFLIISLLVFFSYVSKLNNLAIIVALTDSASQAKVARSDMSNNFSGKYHWYTLFMHDLASLLSFALFSNYLISKNKVNMTFFIFSFLLCVASFIISVQKAPVIWYLIGLYLTYLVTVNYSRVPVARSLKWIVFVLFLLVLFYVFFMGVDSPYQAIGSIFSRAFTGSIGASYYYLEFIPEHQDYLLGRTFPNPGGLLPYQPYSIAVEVMNWRFSELYEQNVVGSAPTVFWGEAYANFSFFGVFIIPWIIGTIIYFVSYLISKIRKSPIQIGMLIWTILHYKSIAFTGFSTFVLDIPLLILMLIVIFISIAANRSENISKLQLNKR